MLGLPLCRVAMTMLAGLVLLMSSSLALSESPAQSPIKAEPVLDIFKSPTCGCCKIWIDHLEDNGFKTQAHDLGNVQPIKEKYQIASEYRSCHTGVSADGYVFEGHVPARLIARFLKEKPEGAIGLAVPGMPTGSPGMEHGDKITPYDVLLLKSDGTSSVYEHVTTLEQVAPKTI